MGRGEGRRHLHFLLLPLRQQLHLRCEGVLGPTRSSGRRGGLAVTPRGPYHTTNNETGFVVSQCWMITVASCLSCLWSLRITTISSLFDAPDPSGGTG